MNNGLTTDAGGEAVAVAQAGHRDFNAVRHEEPVRKVENLGQRVWNAVPPVAAATERGVEELEGRIWRTEEGQGAQNQTKTEKNNNEATGRSGEPGGAWMIEDETDPDKREIVEEQVEFGVQDGVGRAVELNGGGVERSVGVNVDKSVDGVEQLGGVGAQKFATEGGVAETYKEKIENGERAERLAETGVIAEDAPIGDVTGNGQATPMEKLMAIDAMEDGGKLDKEGREIVSLLKGGLYSDKKREKTNSGVLWLLRQKIKKDSNNPAAMVDLVTEAKQKALLGSFGRVYPSEEGANAQAEVDVTEKSLDLAGTRQGTSDQMAEGSQGSWRGVAA